MLCKFLSLIIFDMELKIEVTITMKADQPWNMDFRAK